MTSKLSREDLERIARGLMSHKNFLREEVEWSTDQHDIEFNEVEIREIDDLALKLDLVGDYFVLEEK
jgi:hypothetical protein